MQRLEAVIFSQGDELTTGQIVDTNSSWIAGHLWTLGVPVRRVLTVPDRLSDLTDAFAEAVGLAPVVICSGGLGPTGDDLTAEAVAAALGRPLSLRADALAQIEARFAAWGREMRPTNRKQALLPEGARVLENALGTAPGFAVDHAGGTLYCLPGVPHEMKAMVLEHVLPDVGARFAVAPAVTRQIGVVMPESHLEDALRGLDLGGAEVGFRADTQGNLVKLRFPPGTPAAVADAALAAARAALGNAAYSDGEPDPAVVVSALLRARGETLAIAESCTGGQLSARIAALPGAGDLFLEGAVLYANTAKLRLPPLSADLLHQHGAVSEAAVRALASGIRARAGASWGLAASGIAGPSGGSPQKPVGTVHIALAHPDGSVSHVHHHIPGDRAQITARTTTAALLMLYQALSAPPSR